MDSTNPQHDKVHHELFGHREVVEDLLRHVIRRLRGTGGPWIDDLDFTTLKLEHEISTARRRLHRRVRDIVWSVAWKGSPLYLILFIEFQSRPDRYMALHQLTYLALFYEDLLKSKGLEPGEKLPPALPICLYNGEAAWGAPQRLESLVAPCPKELRRFQPRFRHLVIDELKVSVDLAGTERNSAGSVFALQQVDTKAQLLAVLEAIQRWLPASEYEALRRSILDLVLEVLPPELQKTAHLDLEEFNMSPKERLAREISRDRAADRAAGRREGRAEGRTEGRVEGRIEGQRKLLTKQLQLKFGALPAGVQERLAAADGDRLEAWAADVLTAATLEAVLGSAD